MMAMWQRQSLTWRHDNGTSRTKCLCICLWIRLIKRDIKSFCLPRYYWKLYLLVTYWQVRQRCPTCNLFVYIWLISKWNLNREGMFDWVSLISLYINKMWIKTRCGGQLAFWAWVRIPLLSKCLVVNRLEIVASIWAVNITKLWHLNGMIKQI